MTKAAIIYEPGGPEVLKLENRPVPKPTADQVLIRVKAFGLNRSELFTRQGWHSPNARFPRILGIEVVGIVEESPGGKFQKGDVEWEEWVERGMAATQSTLVPQQNNSRLSKPTSIGKS